MANRLRLIVILCIVLCGCTVIGGKRTKLLSAKNHELVDDDNDGICKLMVDPNHYQCEEHKVLIYSD